jgi:hypothetical protein
MPHRRWKARSKVPQPGSLARSSPLVAQQKVTFFPVATRRELVRSDPLGRGALPLALLAALSTGFWVGSPAASGTTTRAVAAADPSCLVAPLPATAGETTQAAVTTLVTGTTLVVLSSGYPQQPYVVLRAFRPGCRPDQAFGVGGSEKLRWGDADVTVDSALALRGGGALLVGEVGPVLHSSWLVARIDAYGRLDPHFGHGGWTALPWPGEAQAAVAAGSGDFVVGGSNGGGCCVRAWLAEINSSGAVVQGFGSGGATGVPVLEDSGIVGLWVLPSGNILEQTAGGNMGCWSVSLAELAPGGAIVTGFGQAYEQVMGNQVFVGGVVPRGNSFMLVGTRQTRCVSAHPDPSASGRTYFFTAGGRLDRRAGLRGEVTFASPMESSAWALPQRDGTVCFVGVPNHLSSSPPSLVRLRVEELLPSGRPNPRYGRNGAAQLVLPVHDFSAITAVWSDGDRSFIMYSTGDGKPFVIRQLPR